MAKRTHRADVMVVRGVYMPRTLLDVIDAHKQRLAEMGVTTSVNALIVAALKRDFAQGEAADQALLSAAQTSEPAAVFEITPEHYRNAVEQLVDNLESELSNMRSQLKAFQAASIANGEMIDIDVPSWEEDEDGSSYYWMLS